jgi:hypothetical protein
MQNGHWEPLGWKSVKRYPKLFGEKIKRKKMHSPKAALTTFHLLAPEVYLFMLFLRCDNLGITLFPKTKRSNKYRQVELDHCSFVFGDRAESCYRWGRFSAVVTFALVIWKKRAVLVPFPRDLQAGTLMGCTTHHSQKPRALPRASSITRKIPSPPNPADGCSST